MDEQAGDRQTCVDCQRVSPKVQTGFTLISQTHGWRLGRRKANDAYLMEWRCPSCWQKQRGAAAPPAKKTKSG